MKKETWKFIIQTIVAILTAILTSLRNLEIYYSDDSSYSDCYSDQSGRYQLHELRAISQTEKGIHSGAFFVIL